MQDGQVKTTDYLESDTEEEEEDEDDSSIELENREKASPIILTIDTTKESREANDVHKVEFIRYRWDETEQRAQSQQSIVLVPVIHDEMTFAGEGDWMDPVLTIPGDVIVFVNIQK